MCIAIDARIGSLGIGIKTFVDSPYQKIAEFDQDRGRLTGDPHKDAVIVSELRNARLDFVRDAYGIEDMIYHCIVRSENSMMIVEEPMERIDVENIEVTKGDGGTIHFTDGHGHYRFSRSKSTLLKKFSIDTPIHQFDVAYINNPLDVLLDKPFWKTEEELPDAPESVVLPLYSMRRGIRYVPEKSGLNQWNASGRKRDPDEIYIPIPIAIRKKHPGFFPERYQPFKLALPNGTVLTASVCQDGGKAIMSNPNKNLGFWLLRTVLHLSKWELATIEKLDALGIDSVIMTKEDGFYRMDFAHTGAGGDDGRE